MSEEKSNTPEKKTPTRTLRYAEAMERLQVILREIDDSEVGIDELADRVKEAATLLKRCREILTGTESAVEEALQSLEEGRES